MLGLAGPLMVETLGQRRPSRALALLAVLLLALVSNGCLREGRVRSARRAPEPAVVSAAPGHAHSIVVGGRTRTAHVHVPPSYDARTAVPLVLVFHGLGGTGAHIEGTTRLDRLADRDGVLVAYPDGFDKSWNDGRGSRQAELAGIDDVAFVRALIDHLSATYRVDASRIYAVGFSNGASFTQRLGCELADRLAAIASVAGQLPPAVAARCRPARPIAVLGLYGVHDPLNPYEGGEPTRGPQRGAVLSVAATMDVWRTADSCERPRSRQPLPVRVNDGTRAWEERFPNCAEGVEVVLYGVEGMGHAWPPAAPAFQRIAGSTSGNIDASEVIWEFVRRHRLR